MIAEHATDLSVLGHLVHVARHEFLDVVGHVPEGPRRQSSLGLGFRVVVLPLPILILGILHNAFVLLH